MAREALFGGVGHLRLLGIFALPKTESSLTRMHMRLNKCTYSLIPCPARKRVLRFSIEPAEAFHAVVHSVRRCARGKAALRVLAACWSRYKWPDIKEAYESIGF